jgi:SM-20-related protein
MLAATASLLPNQLQHLQQHRYVVVPNWLPSDLISRLQVDALAVDAEHGFECGIGVERQGSRHRNPSVRRSRQVAFYPPPPNRVGCQWTRSKLIEAVDGLRDQLQASDLLALPRLERFSTELNYLLYPVGGHYARHMDQPYGDEGWVRLGRGAADGGSLGGGCTRRVLSFILYLNRGWNPANGGALRLFPAHERGWGTAESQTAPHTEDVLPEGGTLVLLMSGDVEHLVRETHAERQCVVGWFHESSCAPVLDLEPTSLRTLRLLNRKATVRSCRELSDALERSARFSANSGIG